MPHPTSSLFTLNFLMKKKIDPLHAFKNLPPEVETELRNLFQVHTFDAGEAVFLQGDAPKRIFLVIQGRIKIARVTPEGHESILCVRGPGSTPAINGSSFFFRFYQGYHFLTGSRFSTHQITSGLKKRNNAIFI